MTLRHYLRPTAFVDAPFGHDGKVARLAGGMLWFAAVERVTMEGRRRISSELIPVERVEDALALGSEAERAWLNLTSPRAPLQLRERVVRLDQPQVAGILNVTPDSFSDGGRFDDGEAAAQAGFAMAEAGAAIVDVGGESTRPGAKPVWEGDEIERVLPAVTRLAAGGTAVSIDSRKSAVMGAALRAGAAMVNDVSALTHDERSAALVAEAGCPVVLMHHKGDPETMQQAPSYDRPVLFEVYDWLEVRIDAAVAAGIERSRIVVDPGIGFGKNVQHNLDLLNGLALLHGLGCPIMLGASRKRMIGALSAEAPADARLPGSLALALKAADQGAQLLRVHDVPETVQALRIWRGLRDAALTPG
ncbi:MAG TPA: dihydropteroate synthase [Allosphingosinicella sp.]|jgi:dihydropteroate synthase|nr:dihydropteroate synthase [Allosphingosinicella sp.]